jgi:hypothetical protein
MCQPITIAGRPSSNMFRIIRPDELDEPPGPSGPYSKPDAQGISRYRLLVSRAMSCIFPPGLSDESFWQPTADPSLPGSSETPRVSTRGS